MDIAVLGIDLGKNSCGVAGLDGSGKFCGVHRERRRQGLRCLMIELRETEIDVLIGKGLLNSEMRHDLRVVREALHAHLEQTLASTP